MAGQSGVAGANSYQLNSPTWINLDSDNSMYILDVGNNRIQRWFSDATYGVTIVASSSLANGRGMSFDLSGNLIVADYANHRILSFNNTCCKWGKSFTIS